MRRVSLVLSALAACTPGLEPADVELPPDVVGAPPLATIPAQRPPPKPAQPRPVEQEPAQGEPARPEPVALGEVGDADERSACKQARATDAASRWESAFGAGAIEASDLHEVALDDVNADGAPEVMLIAERECGATGNCPRLLYFSQTNACAKFATAFWATVESVQVLRSRHRGIADLRTYLKGGCAGTEGSVTTFRWNGHTYVEHRVVECACVPDDAPDPDRSPSCPGFARWEGR